LERVRSLGFDHLCIAPVFAPGAFGDVFLAADFEAAAPILSFVGPVDQAVAEIAALCRRYDLALLLDLVVDRLAIDSPALRRPGFPFGDQPPDRTVIDPRLPPAEVHTAFARLDDPASIAALTSWWADRLTRLIGSGAAGFRLLNLDRMPGHLLTNLVTRVRRQAGSGCFLGWTPGVPWDRLSRLAGAGLDGVFASTPWWDGRASWYLEEHEMLRRVAPVIGVAEAPFADRLAQRGSTLCRRSLKIAAATGDGVLVPVGFEFLSRRPMDPRFSTPEDLVEAEQEAGAGLVKDITAANALVDRLAASGLDGVIRSLTGPGSRVAALQRGKRAVILINSDLTDARPLPIDFDAEDVNGDALAAGEVRVAFPRPQPAIVDYGQPLGSAMKAPRIVIDKVTPRVEGGSFAAKRIVGQTITVEADVFIDGHDVLDAELQWKAVDEKNWKRVPMIPVGNDRWRATITPARVGRWVFTVEAWLDELATVRRAMRLKQEAGIDVSVELAEEKQLVASGTHRAFAARHEPLALEVERAEAAFASWYELFPRSQTDAPARHGTFADVIERLPRIRDMGFDVLYFTPIHPIGTTNRKGRNNSLTVGPHDVGSPYATGSPEGGHDALHPELGTIEDFRCLIAAARDHGLEIALDFAIQCSPDHPWLREHPDWFRRRPDGSIKYAENPPKKYEDIVNVDFYAEGAVPDLWEALRDVVLHWVDEGIRLFRVDNPHTKPLPFWQWMISDIRGRHPDVIFLSEAFTRPKMMYRLAKVGFSQSYSYFTWRNTKRELMDYMTELTTTDLVEFFRPHFFVNTPDINPFFLQSSGRAGFLIRAALAATLSGLWGVYSGFEICESAALPGREEYLDSEKYEIRVRDFEAPGNIVAEITALNRIRRSHPAMHSHLGLSFYNADNDQVLVYGKALPSHEDMIFVAVSLDPHQPQETTFEIPLWEWNLPDNSSLKVEDLMSRRSFVWMGKFQRLRLDPAVLPFAVWRLSPQLGDAA
jgi:starch synthase (maltosyl-transferring)